jgi:biopolymer transport protein ExbD
MSGRRGSRQDVELNVASMLDMAFQLLTFFILTFHPPAMENQLGLRLPPAQPRGCNPHPASVPILSTLTVTVLSQSGRIDALMVGQDEAKDLGDLAGMLTAVFKNPHNPFDQVIVQADPKLRYGELMRVVDVCARQTVSGKRLERLSFLELPEARDK